MFHSYCILVSQADDNHGQSDKTRFLSLLPLLFADKLPYVAELANLKHAVSEPVKTTCCHDSIKEFKEFPLGD